MTAWPPANGGHGGFTGIASPHNTMETTLPFANKVPQGMFNAEKIAPDTKQSATGGLSGGYGRGGAPGGH